MKFWHLVVLSGLLAAGWAWAEDGHGEPSAPHGEAQAAGAAHGGHGASGPKTKAEETAEYILHHVADDEEFALEIPVPPFHAFTVPIAETFGFLKFEAEPGACSRPVDKAFASFPSLGAFLGGCYDLRPTKAILMMWVAVALLFVVIGLGRARDANGVPRGLFSHIVEVLALYVRDEIAVPNIGKAEAERYTPYLTSLFFFILFTNWLGLIPGLFTGTGVLAVTAALAIITFVVTQVAAIRAAGVGGYLSHLTGGVPTWMWPIMVPVEVLGLFTKPFALLVRLFANMLGGHMVIFFLLSLIFVWTAGAAVVSVPLAIGIYLLEIFVGILQAYLFTLLTSLFIGQGVAMGHHHGHEHEADIAHGPDGHAHGHAQEAATH